MVNPYPILVLRYTHKADDLALIKKNELDIIREKAETYARHFNGRYKKEMVKTGSKFDKNYQALLFGHICLAVEDATIRGQKRRYYNAIIVIFTYYGYESKIIQPIFDRFIEDMQIVSKFDLTVLSMPDLTIFSFM